MFRSYYEANRPYRQLGTSGDHNGERGRDPAQVVIAIRMNAFLVILKSYRSMGQAKLKLEGVE